MNLNVKEFLSLETKQDLAQFFGLTTEMLGFYLYRIPDERKYASFEIPKKTGGTRKIKAPALPIRKMQERLAEVLVEIYQPRPCVQGFVKGRGIVENARGHSGKNIVLNIDIQDFFHSISFRRIRGLLSSPPFGFTHDVAVWLAHLCCCEKHLPQGSPASPVLSNMICQRLDRQLVAFAKKNRLKYSRYADDITFSGMMAAGGIPAGLARKGDKDQWVAGIDLVGFVTANGFQINERKTRLYTRKNRQEVTGLTVNEFPNVSSKFIKRVRAQLYSLERDGPELAYKIHNEKFKKRHSPFFRGASNFTEIIRGEIEYIGMVRGKDDKKYRDLLHQFGSIMHISELMNQSAPMPCIYTEGKTDWMHIKNALQSFKKRGRFTALQVRFDEYEYAMGDTQLEHKHELDKKKNHVVPQIFIFDRDRPKIVDKFGECDGYKSWGNNVYSLVLPVPRHRPDVSDICIEHYYKDEDLRRADKNGRRLYTGDEFDAETGVHVSNLILRCADKRRKRGCAAILDKVLDDRDDNVALSKAAFVNAVTYRVPGFEDVDLSAFELIFSEIEKICRAKESADES